MGDVYNATRVPNILGAQITLVVLATLSVAFRLLARRMSAAKFWWDDAIIIVAVVSEPEEMDVLYYMAPFD